MNCYGSKRLLNLTEIDKVRCHYTLGRYLKRNNNNKRERDHKRKERKKKESLKCQMLWSKRL